MDNTGCNRHLLCNASLHMKWSVIILTFNVSDTPGEDVDPFELLEPVNILAMLPKDFFEKIVSNNLVARLY